MMKEVSGQSSRKRVLRKALLIALVVVSCLFPGCSCFKQPQRATKKRVKKVEVAAIVCPLCGREVTEAAYINRRPLAVKVENDPAARPQSGLDKACVVYEEITEAGITRFMAMYLCRDADPVGPVRSARPVDVDIVFPYNAVFAHCGGGGPTLRMIKQSGIPDLDEFTWAGAYWRTRDRRAPHNLYTSTPRLREAGDKAYPFQGTVGTPFEFLTGEQIKKMEKDREEELSRAARARSVPQQYTPLIAAVNNIYIPYTKTCAVRYSYDPANRSFLRFVANLPHTDLRTGRQLAADTVIVQYVTENRSGIRDVYGADSPELGVVGSGRAQVYTMGQLIDANWEKSAREEHTRYVDNSGHVIKLKSGAIWIQLVPTTRQVTTD